jgi:hypothetical protein
LRGFAGDDEGGGLILEAAVAILVNSRVKSFPRRIIAGAPYRSA